MEGVEGERSERYGWDRVAAAEQESTKYRQMTIELVKLHRQALEMVDDQVQFSDQQVTIKSGIVKIRLEMAAILARNLLESDNTDDVMSYILYLIHAVSAANTVEVEMAGLLNQISGAANDMAKALGMAPIVGGIVDAGQTQGQADPDYVTGTGQKVFGVHEKLICNGDWCVVHRPVPGPWDTWLTNWSVQDVLDTWQGFERVCPHGVPHPAMEEILRGNVAPNHNCCGVCPCGPPKAVPRFDHRGELEGYA